MAHKTPISRTRFALNALYVWSVFVAAYAIWAFVIPHKFTFGPEIGATASFVFFVVRGSVPYWAVVFILCISPFLSASSHHNDRRA